MTIENPLLAIKEISLEERIKIMKEVEEDSINAERQAAEIIRISDASIRYNKILDTYERLEYK